MCAQIIRYSEAFKRQVVSEYEAGLSANALRGKYGITGCGTIERWVRQYAHAGLRHELIVIQRADEREREKKLEKQVQELESALAQVTLEKIALETSLSFTGTPSTVSSRPFLASTQYARPGSISRP